MALEDFTEDALKDDLERRKKKKIAPPKPKGNPDWMQLLATMTTAIEYMVKDGYEDEDVQAYMAEAAWEAAYGKEFWEWKKATGIHRL